LPILKRYSFLPPEGLSLKAALCVLSSRRCD
jgi:hypothetical protein